MRKSSNGRYRSLQGIYNPRVGGPYKGPSKKPIFRSKMELRLMTMLDSVDAENVVSWMYEAKRIPYLDKSEPTVDSRGLKHFPTRNYVIDFIVTLKGVGGTKTFWIEVKSIHDIEVNKKHRSTKNARISEKIKVKNYCKWMAAAHAAKNVGAQFLVVTEKELDGLAKMIFGR